MNNRMNAYILFGNDDVDDAADDRDEVEYIPRVTEVILLQQPTARATMLNCLIITVTVTDTLTTDTCLHEIMCAVKAVDSLSHGKEKRQRNKTQKLRWMKYGDGLAPFILRSEFTQQFWGGAPTIKI